MALKKCGIKISKTCSDASIKINKKLPIIKKVETLEKSIYSKFYILKNVNIDKLNNSISNCLIEFNINNERKAMLINEENNITNIIENVYNYIDLYRNDDIDDYCCNILEFNLYSNYILDRNYDHLFIKNTINKFNFGTGLDTKLIDIMKYHNIYNITKIKIIKIPLLNEIVFHDPSELKLSDIVEC